MNSWNPPKTMFLCAALGASVPIAFASRDFMHRLSWALGGHSGPRANWGEPLFLGLMLGVVSGFSGAALGYIIESVRGGEEAARDRWLAWFCVLFWGAQGAFGAFYVPRLRPIFDSFGRDLPTSTQLLLGGRPVFMMLFVSALAGAVALTIKPAGTARRKIIWACAGTALLAAYWTIAALFAPMFMGSLAGPG
ncbi:MAG: hypothetical protein HY554_15315 [Elusimicrobia bacterium]|nr:hypothetical protein [Elusimicrobiota bacterium]